LPNRLATWPRSRSADLWKRLSPKQKEFQADLKRLAYLISIAVVDHWTDDGQWNFRYRTEFENATVAPELPSLFEEMPT
jgi:hypothetical protein